MPGPLHTFHGVAVDKVPLKEVAAIFPSGKRTPHELIFIPEGGEGDVFVYPFGAMVFHNVPAATREAVLARLRQTVARPVDGPPISEDFSVRESSAPADSADATFIMDHLTPDRIGVVALTVGQSVAMEYYERIIEQMFADTANLVDRLKRRGTVPVRTRPLHRFIGAAIGTRSEVLSVLHLLDKPDAAWDDPGLDRMYETVRGQFDLVDRYEAMEAKLRSVQEALELVLDVARDRRLVALEAAIVALIVLEILLSLLHR